MSVTGEPVVFLPFGSILRKRMSGLFQVDEQFLVNRHRGANVPTVLNFLALKIDDIEPQ
jgi:hypothetical protein